VFPLQLEPNASGSILFKPVIFLALASFNRLLAYALTDAKPVGTGEAKTRSLALFRDLRRRVSVTVRRATSGMTCMCVGPPYHKYASYSRRRQMHCLRGSDGRVLMRHLPCIWLSQIGFRLRSGAWASTVVQRYSVSMLRRMEFADNVAKRVNYGLIISLL
jgi:hypothetical protein